MNHLHFSYLVLSFGLILSFSLPTISSGEVGGISGSTSVTVSVGTANAPTYRIITAVSDKSPVFTGAVSAISGNNITFDSITDDENVTVTPFETGAFDKDAQVPVITSPSPSSGSILDSSYGTPSSYITYGGGFNSSGSKFGGSTTTIRLIFSAPEGSSSGSSSAEGYATVSSGEVTDITITNEGSGYSSTPTVTFVGGAHFVRNISENSNYFGRTFLISDCTTTALTLNFDRVAETNPNADTFFDVGDLVEVFPASTLGSYFGSAVSDLPSNFTAYSTGDIGGGTADWVYLWDLDVGGYIPFIYASAPSLKGWYANHPSASFARQNQKIIYPDESVIVANRTPSDFTLEIEGDFASGNQQVYLPEAGNQLVCNNPYGLDLLLAELIPSTSIGSSSTKFRPSSAAGDSSGDSVTFIVSDLWKSYFYKSGVNDSVTSLMVAGAKSGSGGSNALSSSDLFIGSGTVTAVETCTDANGGGATTNGTNGDYTKLSLSGTTPGTGFTITISDVQGYMLSDDGGSEVNATTGESVETNGTGSIVYSSLNGTHEVVGSGSGYVVIEKQRDINFKSNEGSPAWNIGTTGAGYSQSANWWAVGGGGSGAKGTVTTSGSFTVTAGGSGYTSAPQIIISGGGWRYETDTAPKGNETLGGNEGIIIRRGGSGSATATYIDSTNPLE